MWNRIHSLRNSRSIVLVRLWLVLASVCSVSEAEEVDFARDILPILSENCLFCHGTDEAAREADLRLDVEDSALSVLDRQQPQKSEFLRRVLSGDESEVMPPVDSGRQLTTEQKSILSQWVENGSPWGTHWSFEPLSAPDIPKQHFANTPVNNPIDNFVQQKLAEHGLLPSQQAKRTTLIRRVTLDLTGLPPTPAEVDAFVNDTSPNAYDKVVDRLLASPAYGERMAWDWLDAARYADTNGYQGDRERTMWPWRDWVVNAFNENLPFDQFTIQQLAGDLLPNATPEQILATGFCRNHMINGEGGRIAEENRVDYVMDMTETMGTVWLGLTLNCCRCHDHKYDPLKQKDYYQFFAYFNQTPVSGGGGDPQTAPNLSWPTVEQKSKLEEFGKQIASIETDLEALVSTLAPKQQEWERTLLTNQASPQWTRLTPVSMKADAQKLRLLPDQSILAHGPNPVNDTYRLTFELPSQPIAAIRLDAIRHESMTNGGIARSNSGNFVLTNIEFQLSTPDREFQVQPQSAKATFEQGDLKISNAFDTDPGSGWAVYPGKPIDRNHAASFVLAESLDVPDGSKLHVVLSHNSSHKFHNLGRFAISVSAVKSAALDDSESELINTVRVPAEQRTVDEKQLLRKAFLNQDAGFTSLQQKKSALITQRDAVTKQAPRVMVMSDRSDRRKTFVLDRGLYNQPTDNEVSARTPGFLTSQDEANAPSRLELARWLTADTQPLTARVTVNRFWQQIFGTGLVKTTEDFGVQGEYPEYRKLLDWLAADFRDNDWDVKRLMRTIVLSHTYRQSSDNRTVQLESQSGSEQTVLLSEMDPHNRLLARGARFRMPAWMLRDQALAVSGLMNQKIGGPSVNTYQPAGVWEEATFGKKKYVQSKGEDLYRRSLYIYWRRIIGPTVFFDNASRQTCSVKVLRTNTPLHSLLTLNETTYVECARHLAESVLLDESLQTDEARIQQIFRYVLARHSSDAETSVLQTALHRSLRQYNNAPQSAAELLAVGDSPENEEIPPPLHAAWTALCLTVMNLDEAINKE